MLNVDDHSRTIIHIDLDCFYAQVETLKNPNLVSIPFGVRQKNIIVTSNYVARSYGIGKCVLVNEALKLCPNLTLVNGEDLYEYRQMSTKVNGVIQKYTNLVEKLGLDENFVDVTELVKQRQEDNTNKQQEQQVSGHVYGNQSEDCLCGCFDRLNLGSVIASEIRSNIKRELGLTSCAGIAHNKLLAKLVGATHKPDQQTVLYPSSAETFMFALGDVKAIPGIGPSTFDTLTNQLNIKTMDDMRECSLEQLQRIVGVEKAKLLTDWSYGRDCSVVKPTGRPQSIGLEDSCRLINVKLEVEDKFRQLLHRLMVLVLEDGRVPHTLKVTVRKFDARNKNGHREQRQCNIASSLFTNSNSVKLATNAENKLMLSIMQLFYKLVNIGNSFHVTLLGLAFTKFQKPIGTKSVASYFIRNNLSVQSVTNFESDNVPVSVPVSVPMDTMEEESDVEPSPKKSKVAATLKRCCAIASPSKLRVADMRLNSSPMKMDLCRGDVDPVVFKELPFEIQTELLQQWKLEQKKPIVAINNNNNKKVKLNTIDKYFS